MYLTAQASNHLLLLLPAGKDYFRGIILIVMMMGQLAATEKDALLGRLHSNAVLRAAPAPEQRGRRPKHRPAAL